jgi:hypothetical protein
VSRAQILFYLHVAVPRAQILLDQCGELAGRYNDDTLILYASIPGKPVNQPEVIQIFFSSQCQGCHRSFFDPKLEQEGGNIAWQ